MLCPQNVDGTGFDVTMLEAKDRAWESFNALASRADMAIVLSILWQNLTTEVSGGSYAAATVHEGVQQTAARYDDRTLATCLYEQVARPFAAWNYGRAELAPRRSWTIEKPADHLTSAQTFLAFGQALSQLKAAGVVLSPLLVATMAFSFNLPLTADQVAVVSADVAAGGAPPKEKP